MSGPGAPVGVLLMTFGSANDASGVRKYLRSVHPGREPSSELVAEFERRYRLVGRSPLDEITRAQGSALQQLLDQEHGPGAFAVAIGMLHSAPQIDEGVDELRVRGVREIVAITLAPQFSTLILSGYERAIQQLRTAQKVPIHLAGAWHREPAFIASLADRLRDALRSFPADFQDRVPVIFTAHSVPLAVVERDPGYIGQLTDTATAVAERVGLPRSRWQFAYQSAGHSPEPWLKPDLLDVLPELEVHGERDVLIAPLQFVADHLEVLYDLDIAAREQAEAVGIRYHRMAMPNDSPAFIRALAAVVDRELSRQLS